MWESFSGCYVGLHLPIPPASASNPRRPCTARLWPFVRVPTDRDVGIDGFADANVTCFGGLDATASITFRRAESSRLFGVWEPFTPQMYERFTEGAMRAVMLAREQAKLLSHHYVGDEHILLGIAAEGQSVSARALAQ